MIGYKDLIHVPFGLVSLDSGKLSTRHGHVVLMEDLLNQACAETKRIIEEKNPNLENKEEIAKQSALARSFSMTCITQESRMLCSAGKGC